MSLFAVFLLGILELFESYWQKAPSLYGMIQKNLFIYRKNIFVYFLYNLSFFYILMLSFYWEKFDVWMVSILSMKFLDIGFRLYMIDKVNKEEPLSQIMPFDMKVSNALRYFNVWFYPLLLFLSLEIV